MIIRPAFTEDIPAILAIINDAKALLKSLNINQWQNGYPNKAQILQDIANNESFVVVNDTHTIMATTMFTCKPEPTYKTIKDGKWLIDENLPYGVIHRLAMKKEYRGLGIAQFIFKEFHNQLKKNHIKSLKIDTHENNLGMQHLIKKMGYQYCGIIYTSYGDKRLAFEKIIATEY